MVISQEIRRSLELRSAEARGMTWLDDATRGDMDLP
jgi:hypothetical protein